MHGRRRTFALITALAALTVAEPAWAGTIVASRSGNVVTIQTNSATANEAVRMSISGGLLLFDGQLGTDVDAGALCTETVPGGPDVTCINGVTVVSIVIRPGGGDDNFDTQFMNGDLQALVDADMGAGDDILSVGDNSQAITALGGGGSDNIFAGPAVDRLEGGPGNDGLGGGLASDELLGGPDHDVAFYSGHSGNLVLDLDGQRDDGDPALGEADLLVGIESFQGGSGDDVITGDDGINNLDGGDGSDRIDGRGGFDRITGDFEGGTGGNDTIFARDGLADTIDCADGFDIAFTDDVDILFECEDRQSIPDLQPDRDGDGVDRPLDCDDLAGTTRPGAFDAPGDGIDQDCNGADAVDGDRDRDGFGAGFDCDDGNRAIHPGANEVLGNRVDEDCDNVADPFAAFPTVVLLSARIGAVTDVAGLVLVDLDGGERVRITCKGRGCRFKRRTARAGVRADSLILDRLVRGHKLRPGARLIVRMTRADGVSKTVTFTARDGRPPKQRTRCDAPGDGRVARC